MSTNALLTEQKELACWIGRQLFERKMGSGTTGNLSFRHGDKIYITASGTCFGRLTPEDFSCVDFKNMSLRDGKRPSKELPLHKIAYELCPGDTAVIHVHSTYAVIWSCLSHDNETDCIPQYTPYLKMTLGSVGLVPYAKPGSEDLFDQFKRHAPESDGWILKNHGPVVTGSDLMKAFGRLEELEENCRIAWEMQGKNGNLISNV